MNKKMTEQDFDRLAEETSEMIGFKSGSTVAYDVAGYTRCWRNPVESSDLPAWDINTLGLSPQASAALPSQADFYPDPYPARLAGFRRKHLYSPDEIGKRFRELGIAYNDGLGNGLYESLLINRKYGLRHVLEAPILGFKLPYLDEDWASFEEEYPQVVGRWVEDLKEMEAVYSAPLAEGGNSMVVLWSSHYPLDQFMSAYQENPEKVAQEMQRVLGFDSPPVEPQTSRERAAQASFWSFVRERQGRISVFEADTVRRFLGEGTLVVANPHELPMLDMEAQGRAYEYPAVAARPLLLNDPVLLKHYIAYFTQFFGDLTGKAPVVSVRMNLSAATPCFVPRRNLIHAWYDQAVRHGAGGFYFWTRDYPSSDSLDSYDGPIPANPVAEALPQERWEATLEILSLLSGKKRFKKPEAAVAILVPYDSALLHNREWRRIYAAFSALAEAQVHTRFISDRLIEQDGVPGGIKMLLAPALEFVSPALRMGLESFAQRQGALYVGQETLFDRQGEPEAPLSGAQVLSLARLDIFPAGEPAMAKNLKILAGELSDLVKQHRIDAQEWVFSVHCRNLPQAQDNFLREPDPDVRFSPWMYEHGSEWIMPYLNK
jgi:hypothetical protein